MHEAFDLAYAIYIGNKHEIYKICPRVICVVLKKIHIPHFIRLSNFIDEIKVIFCGRNIYKTRNCCAVKTFFPGDGLVTSYYLNKISNLPIIVQCQGDYDLKICTISHVYKNSNIPINKQGVGSKPISISNNT